MNVTHRNEKARQVSLCWGNWELQLGCGAQLTFLGEREGHSHSARWSVRQRSVWSHLRRRTWVQTQVLMEAARAQPKQEEQKQGRVHKHTHTLTPGVAPVFLSFFLFFAHYIMLIGVLRVLAQVIKPTSFTNGSAWTLKHKRLLFW